MANFAKLVPIPDLDTVNIGLSPCHQATMLKIFGRPGALSKDCSDVTNSKLDALIETRNVGPFKATGIGQLLDHLQAIFADVKERLPELFSQVKTDGMLCCRAVRGSTENFSNHSWGTAIDIRFGDDSDEMGDGLMQLGTSALAPFFHVRGWYWGVGFAQSNPKREDSMHFEASDELIRNLFGGETQVLTLPVEGDTGISETSDGVPPVDNPVLKSDLLKGNDTLEAVADGHLVLHATEGRVEGIGPVQDALNQLGFTIDLGSSDQFKGFFGEKTRAAVEAFQTAANIGVDGKVGSDTIKKLDESLMASAAGGKAPAGAGPGVATAEPVTNKPGFNVPPESAALLDGINFDAAESVGRNFVKKFDIADNGGDPSKGITDASGDPSLCDRILRFPDGTIFFSAKMAIDSDGSPRAGDIDDTGDPNTSQPYLDSKRTPVNAEEVPYFVLPQFDRFTKEDFIPDLGLKLGDYGVVIFKDKITGAFVADEGPFFKIGEASIRTHERLQPATPSPWKTAAKKKVRNASVDRDVLYFVFPRTMDMEGLTPANAEAQVTARAMAFFERFKATGSHV